MKRGSIRIRLHIACAALAALALFFASPGFAPADEKPEIYPQLGQGGWTDKAAMSQDGRYVLTGDFGGTIMLWDAASGREIRTFPGFNTLDVVDISPDGKYVVAVNGDTVKTWDIATGRELYAVKTNGSVLGVSLAFLDGGRYLAVSGMSSPISVWETATGRKTGGVELARDFYRGGGFTTITPGSRYTLTQVYNKAAMKSEPPRLWDILTGKVLRELTRSAPFHSKFLPDGKILSARHEDNGLELWDPMTDRTIWSRNGHTASVSFLAVSANGAVAVSASNMAGTMLVWDTATGRLLRSMALPKGQHPFALSPDGKKLLVHDGDVVGLHSMIRLCDTATGRDIKIFPKEEYERAVFAPDSRLLLIRFGKVALWDPASGGEAQRFEGTGESISNMAFAPNRNAAAMLSGNSAYVWDTAAGRRVAVLAGHKKLVAGAAFSPAKVAIATASLDNTVRIWDSHTGREILSLPGHEEGALSVAWSPDGRYLASAGNDALVKLWDAASGALLKTFAGHVRKDSRDVNKKFTGVYNVAFSPDGKRLVSCGTDGTIRIWDTASGRELKTLRGHEEDATAVAWSPDGKSLVSGGWDSTVRIWNADTGREVKILYRDQSRNQSRTIDSVAWSADGRLILARCHGDEVSRLWDAASGKEIRQFEGVKMNVTFTRALNGSAISPDSRFVLTNDGFGAVSRIWDIATGRELVRFINFVDGEWIAYTPDGYFNASPDGAKHMNVRVGAKVYAVDQFYSRYFRPELVEMALAGKELPRGEQIGDIASQKPAPAVTILSPAARATTDRDSVEVVVKIADAGGGIGPVTIYLNGAQVANDTRGVAVKGKTTDRERTISFTVPLVAGPNEIRAIAGNRDNSMESSPAVAVVTSQAAARKADLYAIVVGINTYKNTTISLTYAVPDAVAFAAALKQAAAPLFGKTDVRTMTTPDATTKEAIAKAFEDIRKIVKPNDLFVFYDASHGLVDVVNGEEQYFLLTSNVRLLSSHRLAEDALGQKELAALIGGIPAQKKVVILDTCNAGKGGKEIQLALLTQTRGLTDATAVKLLYRAVGSSVFSASSDSQQALEGYKGHGLFTYVLLEGLQGKADFKKDGFITVKGLALHTEERVMTLSEEVFKRQQNPMIETGANDFPIGKVTGK